MRSLNLPTTDFLAMLFKRLPYNRFYWTDTGYNGLSVSLPETKVNRANCQNNSVVKNESFMRNKGPVFLCVQTFMDSKNTLLGTCPEIYGT